MADFLRHAVTNVRHPERREGEELLPRLASESIARIGRQKMGLLIITHHDKLLEHNPPQFTHVMLGGRIVETGGPELAIELHRHGYGRIREKYPEADAENRAMQQVEAGA